MIYIKKWRRVHSAVRWESQAAAKAKHADEKPRFNVKLIIIYAVKKVHSRYIGYNCEKINKKKRKELWLYLVNRYSLW